MRLITLLIVGCVSLQASAADIHVPADHATIQAAIVAASAGDVVIVAAGTYPESIDFLGKAITVQEILDKGSQSIAIQLEDQPRVQPEDAHLRQQALSRGKAPALEARGAVGMEKEDEQGRGCVAGFLGQWRLLLDLAVHALAGNAR